MVKMKSNTKGKLILMCLGVLISLSFVFNSNIAYYPAKLSENSVNMSEKNSGEPNISTIGAFKIHWKANGTAVTNSQSLSDDPPYGVIKDGNGGAIIAWQDNIGGTWDIYAQKINSDGERLWGLNGTVICNATGGQYEPHICSDEGGGAIIAWRDDRAGINDIYAQHISSDGNTQWGESFWSGPSDRNGTVICNVFNEKVNLMGRPLICSDDSGGVIVAWYDSRGTGWSIYAQRVSERMISVGGGGLPAGDDDDDDDEDDEAIPFGNSYLIFGVIAVTALIIITKRKVNSKKLD